MGATTLPTKDKMPLVPRTKQYFGEALSPSFLWF